MFQSRISVGFLLLLVLWALDGEDPWAEDTEEAQRMLDEVAGNTTLCLGRGTRRRVIVREGSGVGRKLLGAVVWYAQGVRIVGCILQPRTAVRRLGALHSMVGWYW